IAPYALTAVARAQRNPHLQCRIDARRRIGGDVEPLAQSAFAVRRALRRGLGVGVLADHYLAPRRGGRLVPFLGRRAWTNSGPGALAAASGSPLLLTHTVPLGAGRHRIDIGPEILCPRTGDRRRDADVMTKAMNAAIGGWIRKRPEVWLWYHARFRGSPDVPGADYERARRRH
ncbi:MAG: lysophospholipid acyltransferase family protein, partial [Myxococcota bacterium]